MRADFALDYAVLTVERPQKVYLMARFAAGQAPTDRERRPLNLSLVIDHSGSMAGAKIDHTRQAAQFLVQHLGSRDTLSIVLYNDKVETLLAPERVSNKDAINQLLESIKVRGTTNLSGGWLEGCQHVATHLQAEAVNRVIVMSDGLANRGITETPALTSLARQKREQGVSTTTMGLGKDFNEDLMMAMADAGGGAFYFIESPEVAPSIFQEELAGLLSVVGQNLLISITPTEDVSHIQQLNAYPMSTQGKQVSFRLGDIYGDEVKTLVLELTIPALKTLGEKRIATLSFDYDEISSTGTIHQHQETAVMVNIQSANVPAPLPDRQVTQSVLLLKAAQARQKAVKSADAGDFANASQALRQVVREIEQAGLEDGQLSEERAALLRQAEQIERGAETYDEYSRKTMATQAYYAMTNKHDASVLLRQREQSRQVTGNLNQTATGLNADSQTVAYGVMPTHVTWRDKTFILAGDIIRIGRSKENEIVIDEKGISRHHAQLRREGDALYVEDLNSTNGTIIHGERLNAPYRLSAGEIVWICSERLTFHTGELSE